MTINKEKSDKESSNDIYIIEHESLEDCRKYLKSTEFCMRSEGTITEKFKLVEFGNISKILGKASIVRGLPWKIFIYQNYNEMNEYFLCVSVVCDLTVDSFWSSMARFEIILTNFSDKSQSISKRGAQLFSYKESEYNLENFFLMKELYAQNSDFIRDGFFEITLTISSDPPRGLTWDSRKISGYVGIINQGATCYLNSLLQTLFFAEPLRKIIFKTPTESDNKKKSVLMALQFTFMDLLYSESSIDTKRLTLSFGWSPSEIYLQHDVQEMCRLLIDRVEERTKDTIVNGEIAKLLAGQLAVTIRCTDVPFESKRTESYYDIQLNVKNVKNIYDSFDMYCAADVLDDDNKYNAGEYGMQKALKFNQFLNFPPLLHLHLLRFLFNPETFNYEKVYDRFEFYREIKLGKYVLDDPENISGDETFYLQSVLVHCGSSSGGHYIAFISPKCDNHWYKFDDDVVSVVSEAEAIQGTYGSNEGRYTAGYTAYMLLYIKESMLKNPEYKFTEEDIPLYIKNYYFGDQNLIDENSLTTNQNFFDINVICDDAIFLVNNSMVDLRNYKPLKFTILVTWTLDQMIEGISTHMGLPSDNLQLWLLRMSDKKVMPIFISQDVRKNVPIIQYKHKFTILIQRIYNENEKFDKNTNLMIFLHSFQKSFQKIYYHGLYMINIAEPISSALKKICQKASIIYTNKTLIFYEKEKYDAELILDKDETSSKIFDTSIFDCVSLIIQSDYKEPIKLNDSIYPFELASEYLRDLPFNSSISFFEVNMSNDEPDFTISVSKKMNINNLLHVSSKYFDVPLEYIRLFRYKRCLTPTSIISSNYKGTISDLFTEMNRTSDRQRLYYQILKVPSKDYEHLSMYNIVLLMRDYNEKLISIFVDVESVTIDGLFEHIKSMARLHEYNIISPLRLIDHRLPVLSEIKNDMMLRKILQEMNSPKIRVEEIPEFHLNLTQNERLISVNVKSPGTTLSFYLEKSFLIKITSDMDIESVMYLINEMTNHKVGLFYFYFFREKVFQPFKDYINMKLPEIIFRKNISAESGQNICQEVTIAIEISDHMQSRRYFRGDRSIRIN